MRSDRASAMPARGTSARSRPGAARRGAAAGLAVGVGLAAFGLTALAIAGAAGGPPREEALARDACDVGVAPCAVALADGGRVALAITPRPIALARDLAVRATFDGRDPSAGELRIVGVSMPMGTTRVRLERRGPGALAAEDRLPLCITGSMTWLASLYLDGAPEPLAHFRFETGAR